MRAARSLRWARRRAGLSQRALAAQTGVPQSTIGRIEAGLVDPRFETLRRLLNACGFDLEMEPLRGAGVDRSQIQALLALTPAERFAQLTYDAATLDLLSRARVVKPSSTVPADVRPRQDSPHTE